MVLNGASHAAKLAWVARTAPDALARARWVLQPRDFVVARMTGVIVTDETLASRTGLSALGGGWLDHAVATYGERLPPIVAPDCGRRTAVERGRRRALGLRPEVRVIAGAGDRACEVLGSGASARAPMVSWGTTANVSVPHPGPVAALPAVAAVSRGAQGGFVVEAGLSAAGAAVAWLASITGRAHDELLEAAATSAPGAGGLLVLPWFAGARAPWWRADAHAAFIGLTDAHGPAELTRGVVEGIAFDVARCLELIAPERAEIALAGAGAGHDLWRGVLAAVTGLPVVRRAVDDAASVGARSDRRRRARRTLRCRRRQPGRRPRTARSVARRGVPSGARRVRRGRRSGARQIHCTLTVAQRKSRCNESRDATRISRRAP